MICWRQIIKEICVVAAIPILVSLLSGCSNKVGDNPWEEPEDKSANQCFPPRPQPAPDGSALVLSVERKGVCQLARMNRDGTNLAVLAPGDKAKDSPSYSPDGKSVVYSGSLGISRGIFVMNLQTGETGQITSPEKYLDIYPSFSRDGRHIVFARAHKHDLYSMGGWRWYDWDLYVINTNETGEKRLTHEKFYQMDPPYFSPDGHMIVFGATQSGKKAMEKRIFVTSAVGETPRPLTEGQSIDSTPAFSPDGTRIVFTSNRGSPPERYSYNLWTMDLAGKNLQQLTAQKASFHWPYFFPDARSIIVVKDLSNGHHEIWCMDADGKNMRRIVNGSDLS